MNERPFAIIFVAALLTLQVSARSTVARVTDENSPERAARAGGRTETIATWRDGTVEQDTYASWLRFMGHEPDPSLRKSRIERMLLLQVLAGIAEDSGAGDDPRVRAQIVHAEDRLLVASLKKWKNDHIEVSQGDIDAYFEKFPDALLRPRKIRLRNLYLRVPPNASQEQQQAIRARLIELRREIELGADFADVARRESQSQTRFRGGLMGNIAVASLPPQIQAAVKDVKPGGMTGIVQSPDGFTILKVDGFVEAYQPSMEQKKKEIVPHLRRFRLHDEWTDLRDELLSEAKPVINLEAARTSKKSIGAVASYAGASLTRADLDSLLRDRPGTTDITQMADETLTKLIEDRIFEDLAARRARALGLHQDAIFQERFRWQKTVILASRALQDQIIERLTPIRSDEAREYFEAHPESFKRPPHYDLSLIRIDLEQGEERALYHQATRLHAEVTSGKTDFAAVARKYSDHPSAASGGSLRVLSRREIAVFGATIFQIIQQLEIGETSELVQYHQSLYILRLDGYQPERALTWEEATKRAEKLLGTQRSRQLKDEFESRVVGTLDVALIGSAAE